MKTLLAKLSLKRIFSLFTVTTLCLLFIVIFFAGKQYLLYNHCEKLVDSSQHLLFQFTGIKEHINESLLSNRPLNTPELIQEIQSLDTQLQNILDDILIPEEFKLNFVSQMDLVNITVALRNLQNNEQATDPEHLGALSTQLRTINSKLNGFQQLISRYTQNQLLGLHKALVGLLSMVIALVSLMLLVLNQYITSPILHYCRNLFPNETEPISLFTLHKTIETLAQQPLAENAPKSNTTEKELARLYRYSSIGHLLGGLSHELTNLSNGALNYTQAILDLSADTSLDKDSKELLQKLFTEEKKMSRLLTHMIQFTSGTDNGTAKSLSLDNIFDPISALVRGSFKNDGIELTVMLNDPTLTLNHHVSDLQLVILSALQSSRTALNAQFDHNQTGSKKIEIDFDDGLIAENSVVISIHDNGAPWKLNTTTNRRDGSRPWHNMNFCSSFLQTFGGSLHVTREDNQKNLCTITIPLQGKAL